MTYSQKIKTEMLSEKDKNERDCCKKAFLYGLMLFANSFEKNKIRILCENPVVMETVWTLANDVLDIDLEEYISENVSVNDKSYRLLCSDTEICSDIISQFGYKDSYSSYTIVKDNLVCPDCRKAFVRGAFLTAGSISAPSKGYHLEICLSKFNLSRDLLNLLEECHISCKYTKRNRYYIIYTKESETIVDFLTFTGAVSSALDLMNTKIEKELRNGINRINNCETANLQKTINSSALQIEAINRLINDNKLSSLPEQLICTAKIRLENPEATINELALLHDGNVSKSCVSHRLKKLIALSGVKG